jgi:hypothetical protein
MCPESSPPALLKQRWPEALARRVTSFIEHPLEDTFHLDPKLRLIIETAKKGIPPELKAKLLTGRKVSAASHAPTGTIMDALWQLRRTWIPDLRILYLTESPAHVAMWFHYADSTREQCSSSDELMNSTAYGLSRSPSSTRTQSPRCTPEMDGPSY